MPASQSLLYVNLGDKRGKWLFARRGVTQANVTHLWQQCVKTYQPDIVIDVGVNYGEIIFSTKYPPTSQIIGIEANPYLRSCITRSLKTHPNQSQIKMVYALAADQDHGEKAFFVDKAWSGTSSAVVKRDPHSIEQHTVPTITIDSLFRDQSLSDKRLLFKVDVEGYEEFVLKGMKRLLTECKSYIGSMELSSSNLEKAGTNVNGFLSQLEQHSQVFVHNGANELIRMKELRLEHLQTFFQTNQVHTDLLLLSKNEHIHQLGLRVSREISE